MEAVGRGEHLKDAEDRDLADSVTSRGGNGALSPDEFPGPTISHTAL